RAWPPDTMTRPGMRRGWTCTCPSAIARASRRRPRRMTEVEWLDSQDAAEMLAWLDQKPHPAHLRGRAVHYAPPSARRRGLFACACVRLFWRRLHDPRAQEAVLVAEAYADGHAGAQDLKAARNACRTLRDAHAPARWCCLVDAVEAASDVAAYLAEL